MSKSIIKFTGPLSDLLVATYGAETEAQLVNACQSRANEGKGTAGETKRGAFKGGQSFGDDGTIKKVKAIGWTENTPVEFELPLDHVNGKANLPAEFVKFNDSLVTHFKRSGWPSGELSVGIIPKHLTVWIEGMVQRRKEKETESAKDKAEMQSAIKATEAQVAEQAAVKRGVTPAKNGKPEAAAK
jgi:hypothetical protein